MAPCNAGTVDYLYSSKHHEPKIPVFFLATQASNLQTPLAQTRDTPVTTAGNPFPPKLCRERGKKKISAKAERRQMEELLGVASMRCS